MSIEGTRTLPNATEGFRIVNKRETNDFAFIHDANEIKYEISRFVLILVLICGGVMLNQNIWNFRNCNYSAVGDIFAEQPYAVAVQQGSHLQVCNLISLKTQSSRLKNFCLFRCHQDEISRMILELQKDRFFEELTARYWNTSTNKGSCIRNDDSEGITLESLGGVFIATLVGLGKHDKSKINYSHWTVVNIPNSYCAVGASWWSLLLQTEIQEGERGVWLKDNTLHQEHRTFQQLRVSRESS